MHRSAPLFLFSCLFLGASCQQETHSVYGIPSCETLETHDCPQLSNAGSGVRTPTVAPQESHLLQPSLSPIRKEILLSLSACFWVSLSSNPKLRGYEKTGVIYWTPKILTLTIFILQINTERLCDLDEILWGHMRPWTTFSVVSSGPTGFKPQLSKGDRNDNIQFTEWLRGLNVINQRFKTPRILHYC